MKAAPHRAHATIETDSILAAVAARSAWVVGALQQLIAIDSVAPAERACQEHLAQLLQAEGMQPRLLPMEGASLRQSPAYIEDHLPTEDRPNLVCEYGLGMDGARTLILNSHIDTEQWTQEAEQWRTPPLSGALLDGKIYGRGSVDAKGQVLTAALAILALKDLGVEIPGKVILQSVVGEEPSGNGTLALCEAGVRADSAVVLEPTEGHVAYGHRGILGLRFRIQSPVVHAAVGNGRNAIVTGGILASILHTALTDWSSPADAIYGAPTVNVGRINGGETIFSRPHGCRVECGVRYAPGTGDQVLAHLVDHLRQEFPVRSGQPWESVEMQLFDHFDAGETAPAHDFVSAIQQAVQEVHPHHALTVFPGGCDARHFMNRLSVPTVIFGPGLLARAHGIDEYLALDELLAAAAALARFIVNWCSAPRA